MKCWTGWITSWNQDCVCAQLCLTLCNPMDCGLPGPVSLEFSSQECWSGLPFPPSRDLPNPGIRPKSLVSPALASGFFTTVPPGKPFRVETESESHSVMSNSLRPHGPYGPWNSPGLNTGVDRHSLLQGIFPTQKLKPGLLHCRQILYQLSHREAQEYWSG